MKAKTEKNSLSGTVSLTLRGPARLTIDGSAVRLRTKGLALLCFLAAEGPTRRERMAELLWGHTKALQNLRVEIHRLRRTLHAYGIDPLKPQTDPLELSAHVQVLVGEGTLLDGLDDISPDFQQWLDLRRARTEDAQGSNYQDAMVEDLLDRLEPPFVVVAAGLPGSGRRSLARAVAGRLGLPFVEGVHGAGAAVRYVVPDDVAPTALANRVVADRESVWVVERSMFGEDPELVLQLRSRMPANRLRFVNLPALNWWDVKDRLPQDVKFVEGARLYLASGGNRQYLEELLALREQVGPQADLPVPLRVRAAVMLETRHLSLGARRALECASVHRGTFSLDALAALGVAEHLDELERGGWLRFDSGGWSFGSELARRLIEDQLQEGLRRRSHMTLAAQFTREGVFLAAEYHRQRGAGNTPRPLELVETRSRSEEPGTKAVAVGTELWLDDSVTCGCSVALDGEKVLWSRGAASGPESTVRFALEKDVVLLRVRGRALLEDGMARDFTGPVASVVLSLPGTATIEVHLCDVPRAEMPDGKTLRLPGNERFDHWMLAPAAGALRLSSRAAEAIVEMKVNAYRPLEVAAAGPDAVWVEAYVLERTDLGFEQGEWREPDATEARNPAMVVQS